MKNLFQPIIAGRLDHNPVSRHPLVQPVVQELEQAVEQGAEQVVEQAVEKAQVMGEKKLLKERTCGWSSRSGRRTRTACRHHSDDSLLLLPGQMLDINRYFHAFLEQMPSCGQEIAHLVPCVVRPPHHVCLTHLNMSWVLKVSDSSWIVGFSDRWCRDNRNLPNPTYPVFKAVDKGLQPQPPPPAALLPSSPPRWTPPPPSCSSPPSSVQDKRYLLCIVSWQVVFAL